MKISALSEATDVPIATLKFYLREGLLHPGESLSRTQARYDQAHVERVRLIRALSESGGLSLAAIGRVLDTLDVAQPAADQVVATTQRSLVRATAASDETPDQSAVQADRVHQLLEHLGWTISPTDGTIIMLEKAWQSLDDAGFELTTHELDGYAEAIEQLARIDLQTLPAQDTTAAVRQLMLSTVLLGQFFRVLRMMAQQHLSSQLSDQDGQSATA